MLSLSPLRRCRTGVLSASSRLAIDILKDALNKVGDSMRLTVLVFIAVCMSASAMAEQSCCVPPPKTEQEFSALKPGDVVEEESYPLPIKGYRIVERSIVNPPEHWEGIGHFVYVFYKNIKLCQCDRDEVAISPDGVYAIFTDMSSPDGKLSLFNATTKSSKTLSGNLIGVPVAAEWDLKKKTARVKLRTYLHDNKAVYKWKNIQL